MPHSVDSVSQRLSVMTTMTTVTVFTCEYLSVSFMWTMKQCRSTRPWLIGQNLTVNTWWLLAGITPRVGFIANTLQTSKLHPTPYIPRSSEDVPLTPRTPLVSPLQNRLMAMSK